MCSLSIHKSIKVFHCHQKIQVHLQKRKYCLEMSLLYALADLVDDLLWVLVAPIFD